MKKYMVAYAYETLSGSYIFARQVYEIANTITEQTFEDLEALLKTEFSTNVVVVGITKLDEVYVKEVLEE